MSLKGIEDGVHFSVVDITEPRSEHILRLTGGTTALPVMELDDGRALKESLVLLNFLEDSFPDPPVRRSDPYERAVENLLVSLEADFVLQGYVFVLNQDPEKREALRDRYLSEWKKLDDFLLRYGNDSGPWLFDRFGWAEAVFTPFFQRFAFVQYYEGTDVPDSMARVRRWREACLAHPAAQQVADEQILKLYYDYSRGAGNGALLPGRSVSSFAFEPHWRDRPMPPRGKEGDAATDVELGLARGG